MDVIIILYIWIILSIITILLIGFNVHITYYKETKELKVWWMTMKGSYKNKTIKIGKNK